MTFAPARRSDRVLSMLLVLSDMVALPVAFLMTWFTRTLLLADLFSGFHHDFRTYQFALPVVIVLWLITFFSLGLYRPRRHLGSMGEVQQLMKALVYLAIALMAASYLLQRDYSRLMLIMFVGISLPVAAMLRAVARRVSRILVPVSDVPRILVVGTGEVAVRVITALRRLPGPPPEVIGVISADPTVLTELEGVPVVGTLEEIRGKMDELGVDEVFFATPELDRSRMLAIISDSFGMEVHFSLVTDLFEIAIGGTGIDDLARLPIIELGHAQPGVLHRILKRSMDVIVSVLLLLILSPLMLLIYIVLFISRKGSPIFSQVRVGLRGKTFILYKFRTMKPEADEYEVAPVAIDDSRITGIGRLLRRTSLDELPQLLNILTGRMSLVGPRPDMPFIVEKYTPWQRHRLDVKPGLTGIWQIMGRKELPLHDNLEFDFYYIRNQSMMLDIAILLRTVAAIVKGRGAY